MPDGCGEALGKVNITERSTVFVVGFASSTSKKAIGIEVRSSSPATIGDQNRMDTFDLNTL